MTRSPPRGTADEDAPPRYLRQPERWTEPPDHRFRGGRQYRAGRSPFSV